MSACIIWTGAPDPDGYGRSKGKLAHRVAYEAAKGPIPNGLTIDHLCRTKMCVNPEHLEAVTLRVNILRSFCPPAVNARKTRCINGHEFNAENTYRRPGGKRACRVCIRVRNREYRLRRKAA